MTNSTLRLLADLADDTTTHDQLKYWCKLLDIKTDRIGRKAALNTKDFDRVAEMKHLVLAGKSPSEAASVVSGESGEKRSPLPEKSGSMIPGDLLLDKLEKIENALLLVAGELRDTKVRLSRVEKENRMLRLQIEPSPQKMKFIPWAPPDFRDPLAGLPWWQKAWVRLTAPEKCRRVEC